VSAHRFATNWGDLLIGQIRALRLPLPVREFRFCPGRRFAFDLAWPDRLLACEIEGVTFHGGMLGGRHVSTKGFELDCRKYAEAWVLGWRVLRVMPAHVRSGAAVGWLERAFTISPPTVSAQ